jgi:hypothetical protein
MTVTVSIAAKTAAEAAKEKNDQDNKQDRSQRHATYSLAFCNRSVSPMRRRRRPSYGIGLSSPVRYFGTAWICSNPILAIWCGDFIGRRPCVEPPGFARVAKDPGWFDLRRGLFTRGDALIRDFVTLHLQIEGSERGSRVAAALWGPTVSGGLSFPLSTALPAVEFRKCRR